MRRSFRDGWLRPAGLLLSALVAGCAAPPADGSLVADPYEAANRRVHAFNKAVDSAVLRPASRVYGRAAPELVQFLIGNGVSNLELPVDAANQILQGRVVDAVATAGRFGLNTVFGAAGLLDPATEFGLPRRPTDFGETLHVWGTPEGAYLELPLFGPSTERDAVGIVVDTLINPTTWLGGSVLESPLTEVILAGRAADLVALRAAAATQIDPILYASSDSYVELRSAYVQARRRELAGGATPDATLPDVFGEPGEAPAN